MSLNPNYGSLGCAALLLVQWSEKPSHSTKWSSITSIKLSQMPRRNASGSSTNMKNTYLQKESSYGALISKPKIFVLSIWEFFTIGYNNLLITINLMLVSSFVGNRNTREIIWMSQITKYIVVVRLYPLMRIVMFAF